MGLFSKKEEDSMDTPPPDFVPPPVNLDLAISTTDSADVVALKVAHRKKQRKNKLFYNTGRCIDNTLRLLRLRKTVKPYLRELVVRNSEKDNEHLHLNVLWPCECIILKKKLQSFAQIRATNQRLIFCGRILKDDETIPETCFATDSADGKEIVPHVWMINVGFSLDRYHLQKEAASKKNIRATSGKIHPDEDLDTEARAKSADVELQAELKLIMWDLIQKVEVKILEEKLAEDPVESKKKDRFDLEKELDLIGCKSYSEGLRGMGFFDRGAFSFLREEHLEGSPLFVHSKARKKMVGLAAAYRRQLQYEEQQLKTHLTKMNEIEFSKKYTVDGVEFFHSKAEMDKFYHAIELEKLEKERRSSVIGVKSKFMKAKAGFNFFAMAKAEPPARKHNEVVEELITNATNYNKKDEWELPTRPHIAKGHMKSEYAVEKKAEDAYLNQLKVNMWEGDLLERFAAADAFHSGHVAESDLRRIILRELEGERVHDPEKKLEMILHKGELEDDACHLDHEVLIKESIKVMLEALNNHISGKQLRSQKVRLAAEAEKSKKQHYWVVDEEEKKKERREELRGYTPFNCPGFKAQAFDSRRCVLCKHDRNLHTLVHTKADYEAMILARNQDIMAEGLVLGQANEIAARQAETKRKLKAQKGTLGGAKVDWEDVEDE